MLCPRLIYFILLSAYLLGEMGRFLINHAAFPPGLNTHKYSP